MRSLDRMPLSLRQELLGLDSEQTELTVVNRLAEALAQVAGRFVLPFRFEDEHQRRTSHYVVFVSKSQLGYKIMKDIMAKESSEHEQACQASGMSRLKAGGCCGRERAALVSRTHRLVRAHVASRPPRRRATAGRPGKNDLGVSAAHRRIGPRPYNRRRSAPSVDYPLSARGVSRGGSDRIRMARIAGHPVRRHSVADRHGGRSASSRMTGRRLGLRRPPASLLGPGG